MFATFGWKAALAVLVNASALSLVFRRELTSKGRSSEAGGEPMPVAVAAIHLAFLVGVVCSPTTRWCSWA